MHSLALMSEFFRNLQKWNVIVALVLAVIAFVVMLLANRIAAKLYPDRDKDAQLTVSIRIKVVCAVIAVCACLLAVLF